MARVEEVAHARKSPGACGRCGVEIKGREVVDGRPVPGDPYRHASPGFRGPKLVRCMKFECRFRASDLTTSKMASVYAAQESAHDSLDELLEGDWTDTDEVQSILSSMADEVRDVGQEYTDAADAMGAAGEEMTEKADAIDSYADDLENITFDDPPEEDGDDADKDEEKAEALAEEWTAWREGVIDAAREVIDGFDY